DHGRPAAADRRIVGFDELAVVHVLKTVVARQHGAFIGRAHIGEDQPVALLKGIPGLAHFLLEQAAFGFAGLLQATALGIELPAVVAAAQTIVLDLAVIERGAAVAAAGVEQAGAAEPVTKQ